MNAALCPVCGGHGFDRKNHTCTHCAGSGRDPYQKDPVTNTGVRVSVSKKAWFLLIIGALAFIGYKFGAATAEFEGSDRPTFFSLVGGYAAILLLVMRSGGILSAMVIAGLIEVFSQLYFSGSIHMYILTSL